MLKRIIALIQLKIALRRLENFVRHSHFGTHTIDYGRDIDYYRGSLTVRGVRVAYEARIEPRHTVFTMMELTKAIYAYIRKQRETYKEETRAGIKKVAEVLSRKQD